jgi:hypothetical protein
MTPERAKYVLANTSYGSLPMAFPRSYQPSGVIHKDGITAEEDQDIRALWKTMPGHTCYNDAVVRIARGQGAPASKEVEEGFAKLQENA